MGYIIKCSNFSYTPFCYLFNEFMEQCVWTLQIATNFIDEMDDGLFTMNCDLGEE